MKQVPFSLVVGIGLVGNLMLFVTAFCMKNSFSVPVTACLFAAGFCAVGGFTRSFVVDVVDNFRK